MKQTIIWTTLPNGVTERAGKRFLQLAVFVSPRLVSDTSAPKLEPFDFAEWPKVEFDFEVEFGSGQKIKARRVAPMPELELWTALFKPTTYVKPYQYESLMAHDINSFSMKRVSNFIKDKYVKMASDPKWSIQKPTIDHMHQVFNPIVKVHQTPGVIEQMLKPMTKAALAETPKLAASIADTLNKPELDFHLVRKFYERPKTDVVPKPLELDFHQVAAMLCQYPELNKRMGLVINLEVPISALIPAASRLRVLPTWKTLPKVTPEEQRPWTKYVLKTLGPIKDAVFTAAPQPGNPELKDGCLIIQNPAVPNGSSDPCHIDIVDTDGLTLKLLNTMGSINHMLGAQPAQTAQRVKTAAMAKTQPTATKPQTTAPGAAAVQVSQAKRDVVIPDLSLPAMRSAGVTLVRNGRASAVQKRFVSQNQIHTEANKAGGDVTLYAEDLVRGYRIDIWDINTKKWHSLHRRKGTYRFIDTTISREYLDEGFVQTGAVKCEDGGKTQLYIHEALARWDGWSLSVPRPGLTITPEGNLEEEKVEAGEDYRLETDFKVQGGTLPRLRFGTQYYARARAVDLAGNSVPFKELQTDFKAPTNTRPVTYARFEPVPSPAMIELTESNNGESLERVVVRSNYDTPPPSIAAAQRHIAPPMASEMMAETHGKFDAAKGLNKLAYDSIAKRDGDFASIDGKQTPHPELNLVLPYLPDPMAAGAAFFGLPGAAAATAFPVPFLSSLDWLSSTPFRLKVQGIEANDKRLPKNAVPAKPKIAMENGRRVLLVQLPKAEMVKVRLSSYLVEANLKSMGLWQWLAPYGAAVISAMKQQALIGRLWMMAPYREIVLVHAVKQPLIKPSLLNLTAGKSLGATYAVLSGGRGIQISGKSTIEVELSADWVEFVDDVQKETWETLPAKGHVTDIPVRPEETLVKILKVRHEFGDTKYRKVRYKAVATSRFKEYFPPGTKLTRESDVIERHVWNSARPEAPKLQYVIPTFGWSKWPTTASPNAKIMEEPRARAMAIASGTPKPSAITGPVKGLNTRRSGGGLRVYMERPWFSSGEGELLGVVLRHGPEPASEKGDTLRPYVTQWGKDPIWGTNPVYDIPSTANFKKAVNQKDGLTIQEVPGATVSVAGHKVSYDKDRRLWYCDLEIDAGSSYYPFVRLALARYQPNSIGGAHLSRIIMADFVQLAPERHAVVTYSSNLSQVSVALYGLTYNKSSYGSSGSQVKVAVETRSNAALGELGWIPGKEFDLKRNNASDSWVGAVTLPAARSSKPMRLVFKEYEWFKADSKGGPGSDGTADLTAVGSRLVYASVIEI